MTLNMTKEAFSQIGGYKENPFLSPILDNSNIVITKNKIKYKVLVRPEQPKKVAKPTTDRSPYQQPPSSFEEEDDYGRIRDELNAKYNKMLNHINNKQKSQSPQGRKKIIYPEDLTLMRPPSARQVAHSIFPINRPSAADHSSDESESSRETNWRNPLQDQHHPQSIKLHVDPYIRSAHLPYYKNSLPSTKLLPPPPPPSIANIYGNYRNSRQSDNYPSHTDGKPQPDNAFRYLPLAPEASWRTRSRRKRSDDEGEFRERSGTAADVKAAAANNTVTNDGKSERLEGSFSRVTDRPKGKSASRGIIDRLASPARSRAGESGTSATLTSKKNNTVAVGESENAEDARETATGDLKATKKSISEKPNERKNDTSEELSQKKRNVSRGERRSKNLKNRADEKDHEELLNESPKISGDVIDKEIAVRFNDKDDNKTSSEIKEKGKVETDVPSFDYVEELAEDSPVEPSTTTEAAIDWKKYPFYNDENVPSASALKYIVDPKTVPRKTSRGMEFYDSRNAYKQCDAVEPSLDKVLPEKEEPDAERGPQEDLPHLRGLGDKLDCLKAKYFDENPLDSPLFAEKLIADPTPPSELNSTKFASQILALPQQKDDYVVPRVSKKPERDGRQLRNRNRAREAQESIRINYKYDPQTGRGRNAYMYTVRNTIPHNAGRRVKSRITRPRSSTTTTTQSPKKYQIASYQNQVYEDVMGNIRHLANQIHEKITLSPATQILETAGSENSLQIVHITPSPPKEKTTSMPNVTEINATNSTKSSEIKGLLPPPKYVTPRQSTYRKHRPPSKSRISLLRAPSLSRIIAHHHAIKIKKRSTTNDITNFSESVINETAAKKSAEIDAVESSTIVQSVEETTTETNSTPETIDLEIAESKQNLSTLKVEGKKRRKNSTSDDQKSESSPRIIYTIRDRIRHSKPKWNAMGFGKFNANSRTVDEDNRRKEPRYNQFTRKKKPVDDQRNNSASLNSTDTTEIESATSLIEGEESSLGDVYRPEESAMRQMIYRTKNARREPKKAESVETESEENAEKETESTTNSYEVRENIDDVTTASSSSSKAVQDLKEYLESDPPGYAETFPEEATTTSSKNRAKHEEEDEDTDYPKNAASPWSDDSSEKAEEQVETPIKTELPQDDDSEEVSSKEEEGSNKEQTFFTYRERPSSAESDRDDERSEKASFYSPFPFSKYKSMIKEESDESEEGSEDYVFPWHADEKDKENKYRWLQNYDRFEYPWERRERLAKERQRKQKRANRIKELFYGDKNEEESTRRERPIYPWEKYDVPSKSHVNARRDVSRRNMDDREETSTERLPFTKFSSRYSSSRDIKPRRSSTAREISRSIKKFLEDEDESKEETSRENKDRFSSRKLFSDKEIPKERKSRKRKNPQANKKMSNNTRFDSNGLRSREAFNEAEKEATTEYIELNKTNESESQAANRLSNGMTEIPSMTGKRKKRRRKISQNNSTIPPDSTPAESITESTKRRRKKPQASTTTSATPAAIADLDTSKSIFIPVQRKYSKTDEAAKKSELKSPKWTITPETSEAENLQVKTSTPKTRTIEHRSRISKEKIMRKTIYPDERENFDSTKKNVTVARKEPMQKLETNLKRRKKNNNEQNANNKNTYDKMLIKQRGKENDSDIRIADGEIKKLILIEKTQDKSKNHPLKNLEINKEEVKKINDASIYDGIINDENGNDSFRMPPETYAVSNLLLQNIPPNRVRNDQANERTGSILRLNKNPEHNSGEEREEDKEKRRLLLQSKFIKDPERRLYYYVDRK
ncbi:myosin-2 heavy chain-like [Linepithema humile]|uniref:myosin-2 heavy chain-like n=1 Tax=Linepithema humile TaxID=83485 RepID=UPI00351DC83E